MRLAGTGFAILFTTVAALQIVEWTLRMMTGSLGVCS